MNIIIPKFGEGLHLKLPLRADIRAGLNILRREWKDLMMPGPAYAMQGRVKVDILDAHSGRVIRRGKWQRNMILNSGLDHVASYAFANCFIYGHLGTGTSAPVANDTTLGAWAKQTNTYGAGDGATTISGDVITHTRSFVFSAETTTVTYTEFGTSPTSGSAAALFNKILLNDPISISSGQQAKVTMSLLISITPHTTPATYSSDVISGVTGSAGTVRVYRFIHTYYWVCFLSTIISSGATGSNSLSSGESGGSWVGVLEPSVAYGYLALSNKSTLFSAVDSSADTSSGATESYNTGATSTLSTYTAGAFARSKTFLADLSHCNLSAARSVFVGCNYYSNGSTHPWAPVIQFLSDVAFDKLNTQKLSMSFNFTWGRAE